MPKNKSHKGLLKRVRITKSGKIKFQRACGRHLRSHKSGQAIRSYRVPTFAGAADAKRLRGLLHLKVSSGGNDRRAAEDAAPAAKPAALAKPAKTAKTTKKAPRPAAKPAAKPATASQE